MNEMILRVVKCGECFTVKSEKSDDGVLNKRTLVLQELGGGRWCFRNWAVSMRTAMW